MSSPDSPTAALHRTTVLLTTYRCTRDMSNEYVVRCSRHHRLDDIPGVFRSSYIAATILCAAKYPCILWALNGWSC